MEAKIIRHQPKKQPNYHQEEKVIQRQEHIKQLNQERIQYLKQKHMRANSLYAQARKSFAAARCWPHAKL